MLGMVQAYDRREMTVVKDRGGPKREVCGISALYSPCIHKGKAESDGPTEEGLPTFWYFHRNKWLKKGRPHS